MSLDFDHPIFFGMLLTTQEMSWPMELSFSYLISPFKRNSEDAIVSLLLILNLETDSPFVSASAIWS